MATRPLIRPGGRSERIQRVVHEAVRQLLTEVGEQRLSIPLIAARAEVTPSTIYRRWTTLRELLAEVAAEEFHGDRPPPNTGSLRQDLLEWLMQFVDEASSGLGRSMYAERVANTDAGRLTAGYSFANLRILTKQARERGERAVEPDLLMDLIVAPVIYRIVFAGQVITSEYQHHLVDIALGRKETFEPAPQQQSYADYVIYNDDDT